MVLKGEISKQAIYPVISNQDIIESLSDRKSITVGLNMTSAGSVYCGAFDTAPVVVRDVTDLGFTNKTLSIGNLILISIENLNPDTLYNVYCYTETTLGYGMDMAALLATKQQHQTECCAKILLTTAPSIIEIRPDNIILSEYYKYKFELDTRPSSTMEIRVLIDYSEDDPNYIPPVTTYNAYADDYVPENFDMPSISTYRFYYDQYSPKLSGEFSIQGRSNGLDMSFNMTISVHENNNGRNY
jgi:hypothetical protein